MLPIIFQRTLARSCPLIRCISQVSNRKHHYSDEQQKAGRSMAQPVEFSKLTIDLVLTDEQQTQVVACDPSADSFQHQQSILSTALISQSSAMIFIVDQQGKVLLANPAFARFYQLPLAEIVGHTLDEFLDATSATRLQSYLQAITELPQPKTYEYEYLSANEQLYYLQSQVFPLQTLSAGGAGIGFITTDITEKMTNELRLQTALQIFSEGSEGIMITDRQTRILSVNRAFEQITGYCAHEVIGKKPSILSSGKHDVPFYQHLWQVINTQGHWEGEIWNRRKSGEIYPQWLRISRNPKNGPVVNNYIAVFSDMTERMASQQFIESLAYFDSLTGLANRNYCASVSNNKLKSRVVIANALLCSSLISINLKISMICMDMMLATNC